MMITLLQTSIKQFVVAGIIAASLVLSCNSSGLAAQDAAQANSQENEPDPAPEPEEIEFISDFVDNDFEKSSERAWEYRPYMVAVWFCLDGSPALNSIYKDVARDVTRRSELMDPSGWDITTGLAPPKWRVRFQNGIEKAEEITGFETLKSLEKFDKLMVVCLDDRFGVTHLRVREFDVQTQLWGPLLVRDVPQKHQLGNHVMQAISVAFMPIARIDRVQEVEVTDDSGKIKKKDEVVMRLRAVGSCVRSDSIVDFHNSIEVDENGQRFLHEMYPIPIGDSPVYISESDRFLPVIRRTDRQGNLVRLEPIEFTYLMVDADTVDDTEIRCSIQSYHRAPLSQRKSKRAQKLALVIRPPQRSTELKLVSADKARTALEGFEIWSRQPNQPIEEKSEFLGKTDWRGACDIPPSDNGLRIVYVKRGARALRKLPIMPGLYDSVESTLPNDETRLYAEGVIRGLQSEVLSLVIRREVYEGDIENALEKKNLSKARELFEAYRDLETLQDIKDRMTNELVALRTQTADKREIDYINTMFDSLRKIVNDKQRASKELVLTKAIQDLNNERSSQQSPVETPEATEESSEESTE